MNGANSGRDTFGVLARVLLTCQHDAVTGALHLTGRPGGVFHLDKGKVTAVYSPGAPTADALLLRAGRISEVEWTAALRAASEARSAQAELVARSRMGNTELQVSLIMAAQDAAFALAAGELEEYALDPDSIDVLLPITDGVESNVLLRETARRMDALASLPCPVSPYRERVVPTRLARSPETVLAGRRQEILSFANGRRCARDIAFMAGRSVYSVTVEIARMLSEGLVEIAPEVRAAQPPPPRSRAFDPPRSGVLDADPDPPDDPPDPLPVRRPGASGITEVLSGSRSRPPGLPRLLNRLWAALPTSLVDGTPQSPKEKGRTCEP